METIKEYKAIISIVIMGLLLLGLAYMGRDCPAPTEPVQPETLSQQHGIEDQVTLWKAMLKEDQKTYNNETHINIDDLEFDEAFDLMRRLKGKGQSFIWHGARYTTLLASEIPLNWVPVGDDIDDKFYCPDNYIDECGVCGGEGIKAWYVDNDGDGLGDPDTVVRTCEKPS
tara:strand:- start:6803 stop:7315 length:513 start_codon:yes stop_codon:yes gene_type:complete